ncbi:hypothetical protein KJ830_09035 [bacterium]|nr:hypothetical protein [bacterium]
MLIKRGANLGILLLVLFLLVGCAGGGIIDPDEIEIRAIADSIKAAIETKNVNMFMVNISLNYSDPEGGTYESIHTMAQSMISEIEAAEETAGSYGANLVVNTFILNLSVLDSTANSDLKLTISAKVLFFTVYSYDITFEVIYQKEGTSWKIISLTEIQ